MLRRLTSARAVHTLLIAAALVVSLNPLHAQCALSPGSTDAMVVVQSGDVSQLGDRAGYRVTIPPCGTVKQQQVIRTGPDGYAKFQVSDGSVFEVFPNSEVTFRKTSASATCSMSGWAKSKSTSSICPEFRIRITSPRPPR